MFEFRGRKRHWPAAVALLGMGAIGYALGTWHSQPASLYAQTPANGPAAPAAPTQNEYSERVIAYMYGNIPITRQEFGEYLIARHGAKSIDKFVNSRIIEHACKQANVSVTPEAIEAVIKEDMQLLNIDRSMWVKEVLKKRYNMTLYEWKEDAIKPRLLLMKLCQSQVTVEEDEIKKAFEAFYGEKVKCRMIMWPKGQERQLLTGGVWNKIRNSEAEFDAAARSQAVPELAMVAGAMNPIGKAFDEDSILEKQAFKLKPGEVSEIFELKDQGVAVLRCEARIPPDATKKYETERDKLRKLVMDRKVNKLIPSVFAKLKEEANPTMVLKYGTTHQDVIKATEEELKLMNQPEAPANGPVPLPATGPGPAKR